MLVWTAGMNFIGRPLSYASMKLRPFSPVSPTFLPQSFSASLIFLFSPVVVQRAQLCMGWGKTIKRWQFDLSCRTTVIQAHSCFFCSPQTPTPTPQTPPTPLRVKGCWNLFLESTIFDCGTLTVAMQLSVMFTPLLVHL